ncbi:serine/threonine-protein kinase [Streptomyces sp. NPDC007264]|uniref:serine/threonine-protein kinase n=1 Tax=Streptomyces sp. NPDC007264 TaxID=3364777 RepID=UPI0036D7DCF0
MSEVGSGGRRVVDGRFELEARLGSGGMGTVWRARDLMLHRTVAVKEVRPPDRDLAEYDPDGARMLRERVLREARALARINHPNVVTIHHIFDGGEGSYPWIVMEYVSGGSLADVLARGPMAPAEAARIGLGVLAALRAAHDVGIQHRDVKPANVLMHPDGRPVLTDFGIAAIRDATALTATGSVIGTPDYMAPERVAGRDDGPASDLWSLAMMLYTAVEGQHPLRRGTTLATLAAVLNDEVPPPVNAGPLRETLMRVLVRDPAARPDAEMLGRMLAAVAEGRQEPTTSYALHPPPVRHGTTATSSPMTTPTSLGTTPASLATPSIGFGPPPMFPPPQEAVPAPTKLPVAPVRRRRWATVALPVTVLVLGGVLVPKLLPDNFFAQSPGSHSSSPTRPTANAPAGGDPAGDESGQSKTTDLLTPDGIRTAIKAFKKETGRDRFGDFTVYPEYVSASLMVKGSATEYDTYTYRPGTGVEKGIISSKLIGGDQPVSLDDFDWDKVPALLAEAEKKLKVDKIESRYLLVNQPNSIFNTPASMAVYLTNAHDSGGYLEADKHGRVTKTVPF